MRKAQYEIILHGRGGPYNTVEFEGTRREARAFAREITPRGNGHEIRFRRYVK